MSDPQIAQIPQMKSRKADTTNETFRSGLDRSSAGRWRCAFYAFFILSTFGLATVFAIFHVLRDGGFSGSLMEKILFHLLLDFMIAMTFVGLLLLMWSLFAPGWMEGVFARTAPKVLIAFVVLLVATCVSFGLSAV